MEIKLNLIPEGKKNEIAQSGRLRRVLRWEMSLSFVLVIFFALILSLDYLLQINLDVQVNETESGQNKARYEKISELDSNFKEINAKASFNESIQNDQLYWTKIFKKLNAATPDGISVVKMANKNYKFLLAGTADTRDILVAMKTSFSQEPCFMDVNLPLSSLVSKENVDFQIEFNIREECIKK
ncbi:MAG: hypothetical protein Q8L11_03545 [Candidatus Moranbacteria bacterium]|nr:hypothetical protein [Candidatus Moranbacteria bacterium]